VVYGEVRGVDPMELGKFNLSLMECPLPARLSTRLGSVLYRYAALAAKRGMHNLDYPDKSIYFLGGMTEGTETLACFAAMCIWPQHFAVFAYTFALLCGITTATRIWW